MDIVFLPAALQEFDQAADWYDQRVPGLRSAFEERVDDTLQLIAARPNAFSYVYRDVRSAVVSQFPYAVYYVTAIDQIVVIAVFHASRDPDVWKARVDSETG